MQIEKICFKNLFFFFLNKNYNIGKLSFEDTGEKW